MIVGAGGRGVVVWEDSTAVRRRILLRSIGERGALGPVRTPSSAIKASAPDVVPVDVGFLVAWHQARFPAVTSVVQRLEMEGSTR